MYILVLLDRFVRFHLSFLADFQVSRVSFAGQPPLSNCPNFSFSLFSAALSLILVSRPIFLGFVFSRAVFKMDVNLFLDLVCPRLPSLSRF